MTKRILVISEGVSELGRGDEQGSLLVLLRKILGKDVSLTPMEVRDPDIGRFKPKGKFLEYEKRAVACLIYAEDRGFDAVVLLVDRDGDFDRFEGIMAAHSKAYPFTQMPRAFGIAIESYDSWMLADERALSVVTGGLVDRQPNPESLKPNKSKERIEDLLGPDGKADWYSKLAAIIDLQVLRTRCPQGFGPFEVHLLNLKP